MKGAAYPTFRSQVSLRVDAKVSSLAVAVHDQVYSGGAIDTVTGDVVAKHVWQSGIGKRRG
jgi:hypothetical protein